MADILQEILPEGHRVKALAQSAGLSRGIDPEMRRAGTTRRLRRNGEGGAAEGLGEGFGAKLQADLAQQHRTAEAIADQAQRLGAPLAEIGFECRQEIAAMSPATSLLRAVAAKSSVRAMASWK